MATFPDLVELDTLAYELTARSLREYGNELSPAHCDVLLNAGVVFGRMAHGSVTGRYVFTLPAGLGKTRLMICWVKAMVSLKFPWSVAICAERVEELEAIWRELLEGDHPVAESELAIWHSKPDAKVKPTFTPEEARAGMYGTRRILLMTHARLQQSQGETAQWLRYHGQPRDLVFYDESLQQASYWSAAHYHVTAELAGAISVAEPWSRTKAVLQGLKDMIDREKDAQEKGAAPTIVKIPEEITRSGPVRDEIGRIVQTDGRRYLEELLFHHNREADIRLICAKNPRNTLLIRPFATVPTEELDRMVILDASFPIRTLLTLANGNMAEDAKPSRVKTFDDKWPCFKSVANIKRYDRVTINLMHTKRSGRQYSIEDAHPEFGGEIVKEIVKVIASIPADAPVLVWTFLPHEDFPNSGVQIDFGSNLRDALVRHLGPEAAKRVVIETFGREQANNAYKHIKHVIFQGCLELRPEQLAAQYVAETRDILAPVSWTDIDRINQGEVAHRVYQALHRGACREARLDADGRTQAKEMHVWLFNRFHKYLKKELSRMMPGVKFETWWPEYMAEGDLSKEARAAIVIKGILASLTDDRISLRALKKLSPALRNVARTTFKRGRDLAVGDSDTGWKMKGGSLVRCI